MENKAIRQESDKSSVEKAQNLLRKELALDKKQPKARTTKLNLELMHLKM
ncbi:MAG: hypothetical protein IPI52_12190 [Bacteroidetes bacterium]|nr:hypothetical protein [Bacteroidota bacterium]